MSHLIPLFFITHECSSRDVKKQIRLDDDSLKVHHSTLFKQNTNLYNVADI